MSIQKEIAALVEKARIENTKENIAFATISPQEAAVILQYTGIDASGFRHIIETDRIRHIFKEHGNEVSEAQRGNIAITAEDFELLPDIVQNYDHITHERLSKDKNETVKYAKTIGNTTYFVTEIRKRKKTLALVTMYKTKK
ncbi:MAG: hypothetical protein MUF71_10205 [Candidatus Kapabacteria bacterium]|jgi:hypothetical protein|nr:hypothetical protein [Candidatus Kapabacteria bacterium]